jgi:hypothetical protein
MKVETPNFANKSDLYAYLRANKTKIVKQKRSLPIVSDNYGFGYSLSNKSFIGEGKKQANGMEMEEANLRVEVIANVAGWCDSQMDVMMPDSWKKSIAERGAAGASLIYHLKNHDYSTDSIIGKNVSLYSKDIDLSIFNFTSDITTAQALMMQSTVSEDYDEKCYYLYKDGEIKQHSIGLQYVNMVLCLNSPDAIDYEEKANWDLYYPQVINKEVVDKTGYFWAVKEAKILEVSAVLWGANELTPTTGVIPQVEIEPSQDTQIDGSGDATQKSELINQIKNFKFI